MLITKVHIDKFRGFHNQELEVGSMLTAIAGQNGTQKSTLLGMITQPFTISDKKNPMYGEKPLCGGSYKSAFDEKFRLSPKFDLPKKHEWTLYFDDDTNYPIESIKRPGETKLRFWQKGTHAKGTGYKQYPTIFLSLKRVFPVGEAGDDFKESQLLTTSELEEFRKLHDKILVAETHITSATLHANRQKQTLGIETEEYDWNENSVGQDNLGKIILALFSFERLKRKFPETYTGGILAIDELDATMFPASQVKLLDVLRKYASRLNLQIFFTTHSLSLLEGMNKLKDKCLEKPQTADQVKIVFLKKVDQGVDIQNNVNYDDILLNLKVTIAGAKELNTVDVFTEDAETVVFAKALLKKRKQFLHFFSGTIGCKTLIDLSFRKLEPFVFPHSILIVDGDVRTETDVKKKIAKLNNLLILPGNESPERMMAIFLHDLTDKSPLWSSIANGYSKQVCFEEVPFNSVMEKGEQGRVNAKKWFNGQLRIWGRKKMRVFNAFFESIPLEVSQFLEDFDKQIKRFNIGVSIS